MTIRRLAIFLIYSKRTKKHHMPFEHKDTKDYCMADDSCKVFNVLMAK